MEDETIGVVLILENQSSNHNEKTIEIMKIAIKWEFQNRGIGKRFLEYVIGEIRKGDTTTIEIGTGNSVVHQMLLYQKCGFRIVGVDFDFFRRNYPFKTIEAYRFHAVRVHWETGKVIPPK